MNSFQTENCHAIENSKRFAMDVYLKANQHYEVDMTLQEFLKYLQLLRRSKKELLEEIERDEKRHQELRGKTNSYRQRYNNKTTLKKSPITIEEDSDSGDLGSVHHSRSGSIAGRKESLFLPNVSRRPSNASITKSVKIPPLTHLTKRGSITDRQVNSTELRKMSLAKGMFNLPSLLNDPQSTDGAAEMTSTQHRISRNKKISISPVREGFEEDSQLVASKNNSHFPNYRRSAIRVRDLFSFTRKGFYFVDPIDEENIEKRRHLFTASETPVRLYINYETSEETTQKHNVKERNNRRKRKRREK